MILASRMAYENYAVPSGCRRYTHIDGEDSTAKPSTPTIPTARRLPLSRSPPRSGAMPPLGTREGGRPSDQAIDPRLSACILLYRKLYSGNKDRKRFVTGKSVSERVDLGGPRINTKKKKRRSKVENDRQ